MKNILDIYLIFLYFESRGICSFNVFLVEETSTKSKICIADKK